MRHENKIPIRFELSCRGRIAWLAAEYERMGWQKEWTMGSEYVLGDAAGIREQEVRTWLNPSPPAPIQKQAQESVATVPDLAANSSSSSKAPRPRTPWPKTTSPKPTPVPSTVKNVTPKPTLELAFESSSETDESVVLLVAESSKEQMVEIAKTTLTVDRSQSPDALNAGSTSTDGERHQSERATPTDSQSTEITMVFTRPRKRGPNNDAAGINKRLKTDAKSTARFSKGSDRGPKEKKIAPLQRQEHVATANLNRTADWAIKSARDLDAASTRPRQDVTRDHFDQPRNARASAEHVCPLAQDTHQLMRTQLGVTLAMFENHAQSLHAAAIMHEEQSVKLATQARALEHNIARLREISDRANSWPHATHGKSAASAMVPQSTTASTSGTK